MSVKKDMSLPPAPPVPWRLAVVAPGGLDAPDLAGQLARRLAALLYRRSRAGPVGVVVAPGGAVAAAALAVAREQGWAAAAVGSCCEPAWSYGPRTWATLVGNADAAALVYVGDRPPAALEGLAEFCGWLGVPVRWVRVG